MSFKLNTSDAGQDAVSYEDKPSYKPWTRDNRDNKLFKSIQVKDVTTITDDNTVYVWDFDGVPFKCAGLVEDDYIIATNVETKETTEAKNVTEFWGVGKKVSVNSWVGVQNVERSINGLEEWTKDSFTIENFKRLKTKYVDKVSGNKFNKEAHDISNKIKVDVDLSDVVAIMEARINEVREQWGVKKFLMCLGSGEVFRDYLKLPEPYKGQRSELRPILLKEARQWVQDTYPTKIAPPMFETDDLVEWFAALSQVYYRKTGIHKYVLVGEDKDLASNAKAWVNYGREDNAFKQPQMVLIPDATVSTGTLELVQKSKSTEVKGTGLKWLVMQAFCIGDSSDHYHPYLKLPKNLRSHIKYGQVQAYKDFVKLTTIKEVLQQAVDNMHLWFPEGLKYTAHDGTEQDIDTFTWMADVCWPVAYMTKSPNDKANFKKLCDYAEVDYSKIINNHKPKTAALLADQGLRDQLSSYSEVITKLVGLLEDNTGKVADKTARKDEAIMILKDLKGFDKLYEV